MKDFIQGLAFIAFMFGVFTIAGVAVCRWVHWIAALSVS